MNDHRQAAIDRRVRRLIARQKRGLGLSLRDVIAVCPFRTLMGPNAECLGPDTPLNSTVAVLGFGPEDLSEEMRDDLIADLRAGHVVLLLSNCAELRDYVRCQVGLGLSESAGSA